MPKRKKTRRQKEKASLRMIESLRSAPKKETFGEIGKNDRKDREILNVPASKSGREKISDNEFSASPDLTRVLILILFFGLLLAILVITDNKYHYLSIVADNIIGYLSNLK